MNSDIIIYDNFYDDPFYVRNLALDSDFLQAAPINYNTDEVLWQGKTSQLIYKPKYIDVKVSKILNIPVRSDEVSGFFRLSKTNDSPGIFCHTDGYPDTDKRKFTGVLYLNTPEQSLDKVGTVFLKHRRTNKVKLEYMSDYNQVFMDYNNSDAWEVYYTTLLKFNRLVLLNSLLFHAIGEVFGEDKMSARLAQIFTFYEI